jgi:hypothetical protein
MTYKNRLLKNFNLAGKTLKSGEGQKPYQLEPAITDMMNDPRYLRQSSALVNEALQKGFDVLQLANGDIVTTGTKTVVYHYAWDAQKGKLVKTKSESSAKKMRRTPMVDEDEEESESEAEGETEAHTASEEEA